MSIENIIMFTFSLIGMTHVIVDGAILEKPRNLFKKITEKLKIPSFGKLVDCYQCTGVWCGFFMGFVWISSDPLKIFACGCAGGFLPSIAAFIINLIEASTIVKLPTENTDD